MNSIIAWLLEKGSALDRAHCGDGVLSSAPFFFLLWLPGEEGECGEEIMEKDKRLGEAPCNVSFTAFTISARKVFER